MLSANVDTGVILTYIQNSAIPYNPEASELIALRNHGAATEVLTALLHRGDEVRVQIAQSLSFTNSTSAPLSYDESLETPYPTYPYGYPEPDDAASPNTYYSLSWPWLCPSPVYHRARPVWSGEGGGHEGHFDPAPYEEKSKAASSVAPAVPEQHANAVALHARGIHKAKGGRSR
jgi:hypothetical protein